jgi:hypothetical protein
MSSTKINPGLLYCSGTGIAAGAFYYPDATGFDVTPPANSAFLSDNSLANGFVTGGRDAVIHRIWMDATGTTNYPRLWLGPFVGSSITLDLTAPEDTGATFHFGPKGILMPGGFKLFLPANASTMNFTIAYEVV